MYRWGFDFSRNLKNYLPNIKNICIIRVHKNESTDILYSKMKGMSFYMKVEVVGKDFKITEAISDYVVKKLERIDKYFENATAEVVVRSEKNEQIAEVVINSNGEKYRAASEERDLYASIDKVIDIIEGQIRKVKTKKEKIMRDGSIKDLNFIGFNENKEITDEILKVSYYEIKPLSADDAKLKLQEKPTYNFLAFVNIDTNKVNVIYRLKDGTNFGLVEPEA